MITNNMEEASWEQIFLVLENKHLPSPTWGSDKKSLKEIFSASQYNGIEPTFVIGTTFSNLRTIIKPLKDAITNEDFDRVRSLFSLAKSLTNVKLRRELNPDKIEVIRFTKLIEKGKKTYILRLSPLVFERIRKSTKSFFDFEEE